MNNSNNIAAPLLKTTHLRKLYDENQQSLLILDDINFQVCRGDKIAIIGSSGSGKSTLMHLLSGLDKPTSGEVILHGHNLGQESEAKRGLLRNQYLGFVYQFHHLLPEFSALQNVMVPLMIAKKSVKDSEIAAQAILKRVGLGERLSHKPSELSGGERQRVAIARALVSKPSLILADEPTGNLDSDNAKSIFDLMIEINEEVGTALVMVTHDRELAAKMAQQWQIKDKKLTQV